MKIHLKRIYETPAKADGKRILVERLWPRGVKKEAAFLDDWFKDIAPSPALRQWYAHDPDKWAEFQKRYIKELKKNKQEVTRLKAICDAGAVTFVFAAKDERHNSAVVLKAYLEALD